MKKWNALTIFGIILIGLQLISCGGPKVSDDNTVLLPVENDPTISFRLWFKVGSQNDPSGKEGLAYITANMITEASTTNRSYEQILEELYPLAAHINSQAYIEQTIIAGRVHKDKLDKYYDLLTDVVLHPAFKQVDLERIKSQVLNYLENSLRYSSDEELGKSALYNFVYQGTPYGHIPEGTVGSVKSITVDDVRDFYAQYYTMDNVVIGLGGGFDNSLIPRLQKDLGELSDAKVGDTHPPIEYNPIHGKQVKIVEKDANATAISIGFPIDLNRGSRDWYALALANSWFGEHRNSSSHLYEVIREKRGLNYGDYSYIERFPNGGHRSMPPQNVALRQQMFEIWIRPVPNETRMFALRAALRELDKLVNNGLSKEDFELTQNFYSKYVLHYAPTSMARLGYALDDKFYGIDGSHLEKLRTIIPQLTREEVNAAIKEYLQTDNMKIAIVTNDAGEMKKAMVNDTPSPISYATSKSEAVYAEDKQIKKYPLNIDAENVTIVPVDSMFQR